MFEHILKNAVLTIQLQSMHAVEGAHFLSKPVLIPFIYRQNPFCMPGNFTAQISNREPRGFPPKAAKFECASSHDSGVFI
ncbi:MAG: hypothetical protein KGS48_00770 [Bacteroidetes bacterium]|nr:hypothetical protein [Bacteroidota bacterium]